MIYMISKEQAKAAVEHINGSKYIPESRHEELMEAILSGIENIDRCEA